MENVKKVVNSTQHAAKSATAKVQGLAHKGKASGTEETPTADGSVAKVETKTTEDEEKAQAARLKEQQMADAIAERHHTNL